MAELVLYDGVCGLCNRMNQFILARDAGDRFRFAPLQGALATELVARYGRSAVDLDTVYVIADFGGPDERLLDRSRAIFHVLRRLGGFWSFARVLSLLPQSVTDAAYTYVARHRYQWFGQSEVCLLPEPRHRAKFIDDAP
jgi:predicted DCC family thiol-disulfide oxidoreductase YuxK